MQKYGTQFLIVILIGVFFSSCVPRKRLAYVQSDRGIDVSDMVFTGMKIDNTIKPRDEIYIRISSADEAPSAITEPRNVGQNPILSSYTVSEDGTIKLPYIGYVSVIELTIEEASDKIEEELSQFLFIPSVYMRFVNNKVTVLGEVNAPGVYTFDRKSINILEAVGYAGDIGQFGNRRNVLLIREDGVTRSKHYINLTSDELFLSEHYLIQPDDIIYVEPLGRKKWGIGTVPYNLVFSAITTFLIVLNFVNN